MQDPQFYKRVVDLEGSLMQEVLKEKYFFLWCVCFPESSFRETTFQTFMCLFTIRKVGQRKTLSSQRNLAWFPGKCFPFILDGKHFPEVVKNLEILYYWLIITNLILKLLIAIYILF
jgi:hypothetical protein